MAQAEARCQRRRERRAGCPRVSQRSSEGVEQLAQIPVIENGAAAGNVALACNDRLFLSLGEERVAERKDLLQQVGCEKNPSVGQAGLMQPLRESSEMLGLPDREYLPECGPAQAGVEVQQALHCLLRIGAAP